MLKIGLTGGIGSGKSSVSEIFEKLGVPVIDADIISHELTSKDTDVLKEIRKQLGTDFINSQEELEREKLARYVFEHPEKKTILEDILHPRVKKEIIDRLRKLTETPYAIVVVPLLLETDFTDIIDLILVIESSENIRKKRIATRDNRSANDIQAIINHQVSDETRREKADDIIVNNGTFADLQTYVKKIHAQYLQIASQ